MAQGFNLRAPLIDGQGNFGSVDGDPPAAYRYTEARLTALAESMMRDIDKDTVDFVPNFDGNTLEPTVLPSAVPNLLVNGAAGIAVGMATNIPPHNLREVIDGILYALENKRLDDDELTETAPWDRPGTRFSDGRLRARAPRDRAGLPHRSRHHPAPRPGDHRRDRGRTAKRSSSPRFPTR